MKYSAKIILNTFVTSLLLASPLYVQADDTEVFYSVNVSKPNLMFVIDISGSMRAIVPNSGNANNTASHTVDRRIANRDDDAEQAVGGGNMLLRDTYLDLGYDGYDFRGPDRIGLRFYDLDIPQGAEITNAYIQFEVRDVDARSSQDIDLTIKGEASDNARRFKNQSSRRINDRTVVGTSVDWQPPAWTNIGDKGEDQRTPDLTEIVQSIVDRNDWDNDNGMVFIIEPKPGSTGARVARSFDNSSSRAPMLHVEYNTIEAGGDLTRLQVMQRALRRVLETAPDNVNVGLMNYGQAPLRRSNPEKRRTHSVSGVAFPISDINALADPIISNYNSIDNLPDPSSTVTVREYIADVADTWRPTSWTPIVDSLYEAALYFRGEKLHYGDTKPSTTGAHPSTYEGNPITHDVYVTGRDHATAPKYISPIQSSCQSNYIVLMTDGAPTYRDENNNSQEGPFARIRGTANGPQGPLANAITSCSTAVGVGKQGKCGAEITHYIASHDNSTEFDGDQLIKTYTIGFGSGISSSTQNYLKSLETIDDDPDTAAVEDGYFPADSPEELADAFRKILEQVATPSGTLASPGYSVNVKNGLEHEKDIYIPVFDRKNSSRWSGNLKKFRLDEVGKSRLIRGKNHLNAVDELGAFTVDAWDYWSTSSEADGIDVEKGGVVSKLNPATRKLYSNITASKDLTVPGNQLTADNSMTVTNAMLGIAAGSTQAERVQLLNYIRGWEDGYAPNSDPAINNWLLSKHKGKTDAIPTHHMGDMLHSKPVIFTYGEGKQYIFAATNEGFLHVFDTTSGEEKFAFMPKELLKNIEPQMRNEGTAIDHLYGIDGTLTIWHDDKNKNQIVDGTDKVYLYFGMRRGGRAFYALDITNPNKPKFKWRVSADDYPSMGYSWSPPYLARIRNSGGTCTNGQVNCREALIVSGGYDPIEDRDKPNQPGILDNASKNVVTTMGKDILMFDAESGSKLWSLRDNLNDTTSIKDSIPGGLRILDTNKNGLVDRFYFGDTGGNLWRLDFDEIIDGKDTNQLTKLAKLSQNNRQGARKFFNEPDASRLKVNGRSAYLISIGSGFRAHPMDESITDKFFMIVDYSPYKAIDEDTFETVELSDLAKITISGAIGQTTVEQTDSLKNKKGWQVNLPEDGEKILATSVTFDGVVVFTTLVPKPVASGADQCAAPATQGRIYAINVLTGKAGLHLGNQDNGNGDDGNGDGTTSHEPKPSEVSIIVSKGEIPSKPQIIFNGLKVNKAADTCTQAVDLRVGKKLRQATDYDACRLESIYWSDPVVNGR